MKRQAPKRRPEKVRDWQDRSRRQQRERASQRRSEALEASRQPKPDWRDSNPKRGGFRRSHPAVAEWLTGFKIRVFKLHGRRCIVCGGRAVEAHHVVPVRTILMRDGDEAGAPLCGDARNGVPVCRRCHGHHEDAFERIPRAKLPLTAIQWARDRDWEWLIERFYP